MHGPTLWIASALIPLVWAWMVNLALASLWPLSSAPAPSSARDKDPRPIDFQI